jgi:hypothetical protein
VPWRGGIYKDDDDDLEENKCFFFLSFEKKSDGTSFQPSNFFLVLQ